MSANYHVESDMEVQEPFMFVLPPIFKSKLVLDPTYNIPLKTPKPNIFRRFFTKLLFGWSWENY